MITRTEQASHPFSYRPLNVRIRLCGVCIYRREREWPSDKIWVLGMLLYRAEARY